MNVSITTHGGVSLARIETASGKKVVAASNIWGVALIKSIIKLAKAKKETPKWRVIFDLNAPLPISNAVMSDIVFADNDSFRLWKDPKTDSLVIECKHKPRNSVLFGINFEPYENQKNSEVTMGTKSQSEAFRSIDITKKQYENCLLPLWELGNATMHEVAEFTKLPINEVSGRFSECDKAGLITASFAQSEKLNARTGKMNTNYILTKKGKEAVRNVSLAAMRGEL